MPNLLQSLIITKYKPNIKTQVYDHYEWLSKVLIMLWVLFVIVVVVVLCFGVPKVLNMPNKYTNTKLPPRLSSVNLFSILTLRQSFSKFTRLVLNLLCSPNRP